MVHGWPTLSSAVDETFLMITAVSAVLLAGVTGAMLWFTWRYSRKRNPVAVNIEGNLALEVLWTVIPTALVLAMFFAGWKGFVFMRTVPDDAMLVKVTARMWSWQFTYENGKTSGVLHVPEGRPVKLAITSNDVLHSLFIPAFRVKEDCVPGRETYLWFKPEQTGSYDLFCSEYCGTGHSDMITKVEVMSKDAFEAWEREGAPLLGTTGAGKAADGAALLSEKGCVACHSLDGSQKVGPTFKGISGRKVTVATGGQERTVVSDEAYLRRALLEPQADVVKGFPPIMPPQKGLLSEAEVDAIVKHLKTLR